jgi:hypothetical protein
MADILAGTTRSLNDPTAAGGTYVDNDHIGQYSVHIASGASVTDAGANEGGGLLLIGAADDSGSVQLIGPLDYELDEGAPLSGSVEVNVTVDGGVEAAIFFGLTDQNAASEVPMEDEDGTLASLATDAVGFMLEVEQDATWQAVSVLSGTDGAQTTLTSANDYAVGTWQRLRYETNGDGDTTFEMWDIDANNHYSYRGVLHTRSSAVTTSVRLAPVFSIDSRGAALNVQIRNLRFNS